MNLSRDLHTESICFFGNSFGEFVGEAMKLDVALGKPKPKEKESRTHQVFPVRPNV
jgi:hypothetical protein